MHEESIATARGRFGLLRDGPAEAPLAILLHGFPDSPHGFATVARAFVEAGYRVAAPYLRGYGTSDAAGPFSLDALAADVLAIADALGRERFTLVGHDWGAVLTYVASARAPSRIEGAVAISVPHPLAFFAEISPAQLARSWYMLFFQLPIADRIVAARDFAFVDRLVGSWSKGIDRRADWRQAAERIKESLRPHWPAPLEYYRALGSAPLSIRPRLREIAGGPIEVPTLHLTGRDDGCIGPEIGRTAHRFFRGPFAREILPGGHFLQYEQPALVAERSLAFLRTHRAERHQQ
jgi:pimeloyl-ACP methyl ester carboxylesterase